MKNILKLTLTALMTVVFCFTLASCNKGTCDLCHKENVDRHKVKIDSMDAFQVGLGSVFKKETRYYCNDCYELYLKTK